MVGIIVAGAISTSLPAEFIEEFLGSGMLSMLMTLGIAVPIYICVTGSTPIAAALALKGLSPGAVMVFLLVGPATNSDSLMVIAKILGKRTATIYVGTIIVVSLVIGTFTNYFYIWMGLDIYQWVQGSPTESINWITTPLSIVLLSLIGFNFILLCLFNGNEPAAPEGQRLIQ